MGLNQLGLGLNFVATDFASPVIRVLQRNLIALDVTLSKVNRSFRQGAGVQRAYVGSTRLATKQVTKQAVATTGASVANARMAKSTKGATVANNGLAASAGGVVAKYGVLAVAALGVFGAFKAADAAGNFNQQLVAAQEIMGSTSEELGQLENKILDVGLRTKFSPDEIVEGIKTMGGAGLTTAESMAAIEPAALLATAGQISLDDASAAVIGTLRSFSLEADQAGMVTDKLARITQLSNLQAKDFGVGLGKAAAQMGIFGQSADDTLVILGALRNANIDASSSSTALRETVRRVMSDTKARSAMKELKIDVDKLNESEHGLEEAIFQVDEATKNLTKAQRDEKVAAIFGARGMLAFGAVSKLTFKVMRDGKEVTLKGRDAFRAMRGELEESEGTVTKFNDALLDTFQGQKQILSGAVDTLKVVLGQGFTKVLKPVVRFVAVSVGKMAKFIKDLSPQTKAAVAKLFAIAGVLMLVVGTVVAVGSSVALAVGGIGVAFAFLAALVKFNVGGIGEKFFALVDKAELFATAFSQIITDGFLSGDTLTKIMDDENEGVRTALGVLVQLGERVRVFFSGIGDGFREGLKDTGPAFDNLQASLGRLLETLGFTEDKLKLLSTPSEAFAEAGERVGKIFTRIIDIVTKALTIFVSFHTGLVKGFRIALGVLRPFFDSLFESFDILKETFVSLLDELGLLDGGFEVTGSFAEKLGKIFGVVVTLFLTPLLAGITGAVRVFSWFARAVLWVVEKLKALWDRGKDVVNFFKVDLPNAFEDVAVAIKRIFQPVIDFLDKVLGRLNDAKDAGLAVAAKFGIEGDADLGALAARTAEAAATTATEVLPEPAIGLSPGGAAAAEGTQKARQSEEQSDRSAEAFGKMLRDGASLFKAAAPPIVVQVMIDEEQIAEATASGNEKLAASGFGG